MTTAQRRLLDAARAEARATGIPLWLVGGAVRDLALGRPPSDLDVAIDGDPRPFVAGLLARLPARVRSGAQFEAEPRFGTASVRVEDARLDLARLRTERYVAPGALPTVRFTHDVEADLARRDFTVNAMALRLTDGPGERFVAPWGGLDDLAARRLRVLHDRSFVDDATRLWRGARTAALSDLVPDEAAARLIAEGTRHLDTVSGERIAAELRLTAARGRAGRTLALAEAWGVLRGTHPALRLDAATARALARRPQPLPFEVLLALLLAPLDGRGGILARLAVPRALATTVEQAAGLLDAPDASPETLTRLAGTSEAALLAARWLDAARPEGRQPALQRALARWERTRAPIDAAALMRLGIARGPRLGATLDGLRRARYLGTLKTAADARRMALRMIEDGAPA